MSEKNRSISQDDSNAPKDTIQKNPRKWIGIFSRMRGIYIKYLVVFRKLSLSYLAYDRFPNCFWLDWIHIFKRSSVCFFRWFWTKERISLASFCCCVVIIFSLLMDVIVKVWSKQEANLWLHQWQKRLIFCFFQIVNSLVHSWNLSTHLGNKVFKVFAWQAFACLVLNREVTHLFHFFPS